MKEKKTRTPATGMVREVKQYTVHNSITSYTRLTEGGSDESDDIQNKYNKNKIEDR